jgi:hypothetical protein
VTPPTLKNIPYDDGQALDEAQSTIDILGLRDTQYGRGPWDTSALEAIPNYRRTRQDMADFEDYLHPKRPLFSPLGDTSVEIAQARWNQGRRPRHNLVVDQTDDWNAHLGRKE